jgi:peroxiredoxin Q/BCP
MHRRAILSSGLKLVAGSLPAFGFAGLLVRPTQAFALGGLLPEIGAAAPSFTLEGIAPPGVPATVSLADFLGNWLVLYFYPRDFTGGCTLEARGFQRDLQAFQASGAQVVGVSADDPDSHAAFCSEEGLVFPLLSDPAGAVSRQYGSWIAPFSQRHTFLVDPEGTIRERWVAVRPAGHSQEVLQALRSLQADVHSFPADRLG